MSFNSPFTGQVIQPTDVSYRDITLSADGTLTWPINGSVTDNAAARIMDVTSLSSGLVLAGVLVAGTGGQCSCTTTPSLFVGQAVVVTGTLTGTATGIVTGNTYYIILTNGTTTFTLSATSGGTALVTTAGTTTGLTFTLDAFTLDMPPANLLELTPCFATSAPTVLRLGTTTGAQLLPWRPVRQSTST